jgi:hypothetical protein
VGTVYAIDRFKPNWSREARAAGARWYHAAYLLQIDGIGRFAGIFGIFGFPHFYLRPAVDPRAEQFIADMKRFASAMKSRVYPIASDQLNRVRGGQ